MTDDEIESVANEKLQDHNLTSSLPIDPFFIAGEEEIRVLPGEYDNCFDGRIEYRRKGGVGRFYLFYAREELPFRPVGRVRFSIAHELGHFYLPEHRKYLLSGHWHSSHSDFVSSKVKEREADKFAACLLMPQELFLDEVRARSNFLTLKDLKWLAGNVFNTSLTSTIRRYVELNFEACCVVVAENGRIINSTRSEDLQNQRLGWTNWGQPLPAGSVTAKALASKLSPTNLTADGSVDSSVWFDRVHSCRMWEETLLLSRSGRTITFLTPEDPSNDDD